MRWQFPLAFLAAAIAAKADQPEFNSHYIEKSQNGRFLAEFTPTSGFGERGEGRVRAATLFPSPDIYVVHWFANRVKISNDGRFLVRFGPWATDLEGHSDLAIAFYKDGTLLKSYRVKDLVHDFSSVDESISHYRWEATESNSVAGFSANDTRFTVVTTDKDAYEFDVTTGKIASVHRDPTARSERELWQQDEAMRKQAAERYIQKSAQLTAFARAFTFKQLHAKAGLTIGVTPGGDEWSADMTPINPQLSRAMVEQIFFIDAKTDQVEVGTNPEEVQRQLTLLGKVPFINRLLAANPSNDFRIRASGIYFHWDSPEVTRIINALPKIGIKPPSLDQWIYFIMDVKVGDVVEYLSFYHPMGTDFFVMTSDPSWFPFSATERGQIKPHPRAKMYYWPVIDGEGHLRSVLVLPGAPF
jgi:hypothetical protein